jgi:hypothetical protein
LLKCLFFYIFVSMIRKLLTLFFFLFSLSLNAETLSTPPGVENPVLIGGPDFTLNPNPVNGSYFYVNLKFSETDFPDAVILVNDVLGKVVYSYVIRKSDYAEGRVKIGVMDALLDKGIYFIQLKSGDYTKTLKLAIR